MRTFYLLAYQAYSKQLQTVVDYSKGRFDSALLRNAIPFHQKIPPDVQLVVDEGQTSDLLANPLSWLICSRKMYEIARTLVPDEELQIVNVPILKMDRSTPLKDYHVINLLRAVHAVDMERSLVSELDLLGKRIPHVMKFVFRDEFVPPSVHLFRPAESKSRVAVSQEFVSAIKGKVSGVSLIKTKTI